MELKSTILGGLAKRCWATGDQCDHKLVECAFEIDTSDETTADFFAKAGEAYSAPRPGALLGDC